MSKREREREELSEVNDLPIAKKQKIEAEKINSYSEFGFTRAHVALLLKDIERLKELINEGEDINLKPLNKNETSLSLAIGNQEIIKFLLKNGYFPEISEVMKLENSKLISSGQYTKYIITHLEKNLTKELSLNYKNYNYLIGYSQSETLFKALENNSSITILKIINTNFRAVEVQQLANILEINKTITSLTLNYNAINHENFLCIIQSLKSNDTLNTLDLSHNKISSIGSELEDNLRNNTSFTHISFKCNKLSPDDLKPLAKFIKNNKNIKSLNLLNNFNIDNNLASCNHHFNEELDINNILYRMITKSLEINVRNYNKALKEFEDSIKNNYTLTEFDLQYEPESMNEFPKPLEVITRNNDLNNFFQDNMDSFNENDLSTLKINNSAFKNLKDYLNGGGIDYKCIEIWSDTAEETDINQAFQKLNVSLGVNKGVEYKYNGKSYVLPKGLFSILKQCTKFDPPEYVKKFIAKNYFILNGICKSPDTLHESDLNLCSEILFLITDGLPLSGWYPDPKDRRVHIESSVRVTEVTNLTGEEANNYSMNDVEIFHFN